MSTQKGFETYSIRETAKLCGLTESTLRYYENIGLIPEVKRDPSSKYRVYSEKDIDYIVSIACLSATGMSIEDMKIYLKNVSIGDTMADEQILLLENQGTILRNEESSLKLRQKYLQTKADYWKAIRVNDIKLAEKISIEAVKIAKQVKKIK